MSKSPIIDLIAPLVWERQEPLLPPMLEIYNYTFLILKEWNYPKNFGPYWRLYWNQKKGARIIYQNDVYPMTPKEVLLIPSHIATATELKNEVPHFSVNFKIGVQFENVRRRIYTMPPDFLKRALFHFSKQTSETLRLMIIQSVIAHYLSLIPPDQFHDSKRDNLDPRIAKAVAIMESELASPPSNTKLCKSVNMSRSNFYRLFVQETNKSPNFFLFECRMIRASWLLRYTDKSIDEIAQETGYADRYHFSKAFRRFFSIPPIRYRQERTQSG